MSINFQRFWAMPSADTFDCQPIGDFVKKYLRQSKVSVDPFARNKRWATYTNDLNPNTAAEYHLPASEFLKMLVERGVVADLAAGEGVEGGIVVNWIDEPDDDEDEETFTCASCGSELTLDEGALCPICGQPVDDGDADAEAVDALERCGDEYAGA